MQDPEFSYGSQNDQIQVSLSWPVKPKALNAALKRLNAFLPGEREHVERRDKDTAPRDSVFTFVSHTVHASITTRAIPTRAALEAKDSLPLLVNDRLGYADLLFAYLEVLRNRLGARLTSYDYLSPKEQPYLITVKENEYEHTLSMDELDALVKANIEWIVVQFSLGNGTVIRLNPIRIPTDVNDAELQQLRAEIDAEVKLAERSTPAWPPCHLFRLAILGQLAPIGITSSQG